MNETFFSIESQGKKLAAVLHGACSDEKLVILCHGFTGNKSEFGRLFTITARELANAGLNVLRFDYYGCGDSAGDFSEMTPNTKIQNLKDVIAWANGQGYSKIGLVGMSMSGAVSICTTHQLPKGEVKALVTWSTVPAFAKWRYAPGKNDYGSYPDIPCYEVGKAFYTDRPKVDVPQAYCELQIPKLQVQGTKDLTGFRQDFAEYFSKASEPKKHVVIDGADHCFTTPKHRDEAVRETLAWFKKYLV